MSKPTSIPSQDSNLSLYACEFIAFAIYKLWNPRRMERRITSSSLPTHKIISPLGTETWYPLFVDRIHQLLCTAGLATPFVFMALLYIARLRKSVPLSPNTKPGDTEYDLFLVALLLSQKVHSDQRYANKLWSKLSGISVSRINQMEMDFLGSVRWNVHIKPDQYAQWVVAMQSLGKEHALVLRAIQMEEKEFQQLEVQLNGSRPDLVQEITEIRRSKTIQ